MCSTLKTLKLLKGKTKHVVSTLSAAYVLIWGLAEWPSFRIKGCPANPSAHQFAVWETEKTWVLAHCLCSLHLHVKGDKTIRRELQERRNYIVFFLFRKSSYGFCLPYIKRSSMDQHCTACNHEIGAICTRYRHNFRPSIRKTRI